VHLEICLPENENMQLHGFLPNAQSFRLLTVMPMKTAQYEIGNLPFGFLEKSEKKVTPGSWFDPNPK
jgi:dGTP triphosphohydrolase